MYGLWRSTIYLVQMKYLSNLEINGESLNFIQLDLIRMAVTLPFVALFGIGISLLLKTTLKTALTFSFIYYVLLFISIFYIYPIGYFTFVLIRTGSLPMQQ